MCNLSLVREVGAGIGSLDFLLEGIVDGGQKINVCVEVKLAHSGKNKLKKGLLTQLPQYMAALSAQYGVFLVLWFKGLGFDQPSEFEEIDELWDWLLKEQLAEGQDPRLHRISFLDLSRKRPPSG